MNIQRHTLASLSAQIQDEIDLFICCASYEMRCRSVADHLPLPRIQRTIVAETEHKRRYISENGTYLRNLFGAGHIPVTLDTADPVVSADAMWKGLREGVRSDAASILVDITTFTHEALLILVKLLSIHTKASARIRFIYAVAAEYSVGDKDEDKWLSKGVREVRSVLGYPGIMLPSRRQHLIVLVGFEHERAAELIKAYEPSVISLGHGRSATAPHDKHSIANRHFHRLVAATAATYGEVRSFDFECSNPLDAQAAIEKEIRGVRGHNAIVAPMNTKLSALGAACAVQRNETIQLCYARANHYNYKGYSSPGQHCYLLELPELYEQPKGAVRKARNRVEVAR